LRAVDARHAVLKLLGGPIERAAELSADAVIALTPRLAEKLVVDGIDPTRTYVVPSGVDRSLFGDLQRSPWPDLAGRKVIFVGRLVPQKGVHTLIEAVRHVTAPDARFVLVGDGPERDALEARIRELGLERRVHLTGFVAHDLVPAVLQHSDVLVLPSVYEELGSILVEAMQAGVPIVATRTGGIPDAVTDDVTGLLVEPRDPVALGRAIDRILADTALAQRLARAGTRHAADYDWNILAGKVLDVYRDVLARATPTETRRQRVSARGV
jgi:glycosyltransferase involved in cell wall biosynthesis